jgi:hypothetical protein
MTREVHDHSLHVQQHVSAVAGRTSQMPITIQTSLDSRMVLWPSRRSSPWNFLPRFGTIFQVENSGPNQAKTLTSLVVSFETFYQKCPGGIVRMFLPHLLLGGPTLSNMFLLLLEEPARCQLLFKTSLDSRMVLWPTSKSSL